MRRIILGTTAFGIGYAATQNLFGGLVAGGVTFAITPRSEAPTKMVTVHDFEKGESRIQPMDADTERYLKSRERKGL